MSHDISCHGMVVGHCKCTKTFDSTPLGWHQ